MSKASDAADAVANFGEVNSRNAGDFVKAVKHAGGEIDAVAARADAIYKAKMAKAHVDEAMRFLPMLGAVIGVPPHITAAITRGLESAGELVGLSPEVLDAVKNVTDE
jgi:DNA-binding transcriptional regulator YbjK